MNPALIEGATHNPGQPRDWNEQRDGKCGGLPIRVSVDPEGRPVQCVSAWKPSAAELAVLNDGGFVELRVWGWQCPVALGVVDRKGATEL